jgi:hypothetical protein
MMRAALLSSVSEIIFDAPSVFSAAFDMSTADGISFS